MDLDEYFRFLLANPGEIPGLIKEKTAPIWQNPAIILLAIAYLGFFFGLGPFPAIFGGADYSNYEPSGTVSDGSVTTVTDAPEPRFKISIADRSKCPDKPDDRLCKIVTVKLDNIGDATATNIQVDVELKTRRKVRDNKTVWTGSATIQSMEPGNSVQKSKRVQIQKRDLLAIGSEGCTIFGVVEVKTDSISQKIRTKEEELNCPEV